MTQPDPYARPDVQGPHDLTARPAPHTVAEVLREVNAAVVRIDSFGLHGTILRSDVTRLLAMIASKHGVSL